MPEKIPNPPETNPRLAAYLAARSAQDGTDIGHYFHQAQDFPEVNSHAYDHAAEERAMLKAILGEKTSEAVISAHLAVSDSTYGTSAKVPYTPPGETATGNAGKKQR